MATTTKVRAGTPTGPEFVDAKGLRQMFSIPTTTAYELMNAGKIQTQCIRKAGKQRGKRLFDVQSVRDYINGEKPADTRRLDWMHERREDRVWFIAAPGTHAGQTIREAIDAAMDEEKKRKETAKV